MISLLESEPLENHSAIFEDDEEEGADQGSIEWTEPTEVSSGLWRVTVTGYDVNGNAITPSDCDIESETCPTPSQIFSKIAEVLKSTLCPSCV